MVLAYIIGSFAVVKARGWGLPRGGTGGSQEGISGGGGKLVGCKVENWRRVES